LKKKGRHREKRKKCLSWRGGRTNKGGGGDKREPGKENVRTMKGIGLRTEGGAIIFQKAGPK